MISVERKNQIIQWVLNNTNIHNRAQIFVHPDGVTDIEGSVTFLSARNTELPIQFGHIINGFFDIRTEGVTTLKNCPHRVDGNFLATHNPITNLVGGPQEVGGGYNVRATDLTSLEGMPLKVGKSLWLPWNPHMGYLRCCLVKVGDSINIYNKGDEPLAGILNKYAGKGYAAMVPCARELIKAGYKESARL
jgi:hypothetical protein